MRCAEGNGLLGARQWRGVPSGSFEGRVVAQASSCSSMRRFVCRRITLERKGEGTESRKRNALSDFTCICRKRSNRWRVRCGRYAEVLTSGQSPTASFYEGLQPCCSLFASCLFCARLTFVQATLNASVLESLGHNLPIYRLLVQTCNSLTDTKAYPRKYPPLFLICCRCSFISS